MSARSSAGSMAFGTLAIVRNISHRLDILVVNEDCRAGVSKLLWGERKFKKFKNVVLAAFSVSYSNRIFWPSGT
jgi:hypothetical protein